MNIDELLNYYIEDMEINEVCNSCSLYEVKTQFKKLHNRYKKQRRELDERNNMIREIADMCNSVIGNPENTIVSKNQLMKLILNIIDRRNNE